MTVPNATLLDLTPTLATIDRETYAEAFLQRWESTNTRTAYRLDLQIFFDWCDAHGLDVFAAHRRHLEVFMRYLSAERENGAATICHRIGTLRQFYELALDDDLVVKNPCRLLRLPKIRVDETRIKSVSAQDFERMVWAAAKSSVVDYALILTMGVCGLRVSSACSLDVDTSLVRDQAHRMFVYVTKGGALKSTPQPPMVIEAVDMVIGGRTSGPLFLRRDGLRMTRSSAARIVKRVACAAGVVHRVSPHSLRHTFAETALDRGEPLERVARSLGHKDVSTTYQFYGRKRLSPNQDSAYSVAGSMRIPVFT